MAQEPTTETPAPSLSDLSAAIVAEQLKPENLDKLRTHEQNLALEKAKDHDEYKSQTAKWFLQEAARLIISATDFSEELLNPLAKGAIESLLKTDEGGGRAGSNSGALLLSKIAGTGAEIQPGTAGAERYLTLMLNETVEAWLRGVAVEFITEYMPKIAGIGGGIETVQGLQEIIEGMLGGQRMIRRVVQPFINATAIIPAQWHVNKKYAPGLLSASSLAHAVARRQLTAEAAMEELARQGYNAQRASALISDALGNLTPSAVLDAKWLGAIDELDAQILLGYANYDVTVATKIIDWDRLSRIDTIHRQAATAAVTAFVSGDIDEPQLQSMLLTTIVNPDERTAIGLVARARRTLNVRRVSIAELRGLVKDGIASVADFRRRLQHDGFDPEAVTWFELQLRFELDKATSIEQHRREMEAEHAAEKAARDAAKAARDAEVAARKARAQFPPLADYRRGYVHGLIDRDALADALTRDGIVEDQDLYLGDADLDREAYLANLEQRARATAKAAASDLSIAQREEAVLRGVLSVEEFDADLRVRGLDDGDRRVLTELLRLKVADREKADKERAAVEERAKLTGASHADWIHAVRLGVRTVAQYAAWLTSIGVADVSRALLLDVVRVELAQDAAAAAKRAAADAAAALKGLSLGERRRAVIAGVRPRDWYAAAIAKAGWPVDDQLADLALLDVEIANAAAVRAKRDQLAASAIDPLLSLAQIEAAFKLGLINPDEFIAMLRARGYSAQGAEMLRQLAVLMIPNVRAGVATEAAAPADALGKPAPIGDVRRAVLRGIRTPDEFEAELRARGFTEDAAALMRDVLDAEMALDADTLRAKVASALAARKDAPSLGELLDAFDSQAINAGELIDALAAFNIPRDVAVLVARTKAA